MVGAPGLGSFAALPLDAQLAYLERELDRVDGESLLALCAGVPDPAPLAWLCARLLERGFLQRAERGTWFARFLLAQPETAVHAALRAMTPALRPEIAPGFALSLVEALRSAPLARLPTTCVIDRTLKHHCPDAWEAFVRTHAEECTVRLRTHGPSALTPEDLALLPARDVEALRVSANALGADVAAALDERFGDMAHAAIAALGAQPKALSQSNAEELLARRVYTDPGHFLIELLQNAEDAGARHFRVAFERRRVVVWHDGTPFDARDLVGVTSIGQTTKRKQQIGFFGVGFKSVYEVTDRPQIYSGFYRLEIADVSIPKSLAHRPADLPANGTVLVLPVRKPDEPERSAAALYARAIALDPCVLLTLRSMESLEFTLDASGGGPSRLRVLRERVDERGRVALHREPEGGRRVFSLAERDCRYDAGARDAARPDRTRVLVGIRLDESGMPRPLAPNAATVYSYLPTAERSGLRFFVQGHFDVPVDRERIAENSAWNRWILSQVPALLADAARAITAPEIPATRRFDTARGLLDVLPLATEMASSAFGDVASKLREAFAGLDVLPCSDGMLHAPAVTRIAAPPIAALFGTGALHDDGEAEYFLARTLSPRAVEVAASLGARAFELEDLVGVLERSIGSERDDFAPTSPELPGFLHGAEPARLERLYDALALELSRLERDGASARAESLLARLRALPLIPDDQGRLHRPPRAGVAGIVRASAPVRAALAGLWPFVASALDADAGASDTGRAGRMLDRLNVPRMDAATLVRVLEAGFLGGAPMAVAEVARAVREPARITALFGALADAPREVQQRAARLPLFRAGDAGFFPLARDVSDADGALLAGDDALSTRLATLLRTRRPVISLAQTDRSIAEFVARAGAPVLGSDALVAFARADAGDPTRTHEWRALLNDVFGDLTPRARAALAALELWTDRRGRPRTLVGDGRALVAADDAICRFFPGEIFLDESSASLARRDGWGATILGPDALADALCAVPNAVAQLAADTETVQRAQEYLLAHARDLSSTSRARLASAPAFLDDRGARAALDGLSVAASGALRALWGDDSPRKFLDPNGSGAALARALGMMEHTQRAGTSELLADLAASAASNRPGLDLFRDPARRSALHEHLAAEAPGLSRTDLERAVALPIYPDAHARPGRLGDLRRGIERGAVYSAQPEVRACFDAAGVPLLEIGVQAALAPLIDAAGLPRADGQLLIELLRRLPPVLPGQPPPRLQTPAILEQIQSLLVARREELGRGSGTSATGLIDLLGLNIWRTVRGGVVSAARLVDAAPLLALTDPGTPERGMVEAVCLEPGSRARFEALAPWVIAAPAPPFLAPMLAQLARPGAPLAEQPRFLGEPARVAAIAVLLTSTDARPEPGSVPRVDARGRLRFTALQRADDDALALLANTPTGGELLHPSFARAVSPERLDPVAVAPRDVLAAVFAQPALLDEPPRRALLYRWLATHEREVFADPACCEQLARAPAFVNERGQRMRADELVIDDDLPDLGIGWRPSTEIPPGVVAALARHLGAGRIPLETLLERHLLPAYARATSRGQGESAAAILGYIARRLRGRTAVEVRAALGLDAGATTLALESADGRFIPADQMLLPAAEIADACRALWGDAYAAPSPRRYEPAMHGFLRDLGVAAHPDVARVRALLDAPRPGAARLLALAVLIGHLHRAQGEVLLQRLPLRATAWLADGTGCARPPAELFLWTPEVEALVGAFPELYPDPAAAAALGDALCRELGFRTARDVRLAEVVHHLDARERARGGIPFRVYQWMEQGLTGGWIDGPALSSALDQQRWIATDEGTWFNHRHVIGAWEIQYFGARRGYWERGRAECPRLCALFGIPDRATPESVAGFVREVAALIARRGDREVLRAEPALARMLLACYALLGETGARVERDLPVILCAEAGERSSGSGGEASRRTGTLRLVPASTPMLLRSDTPTLEALFAGAGPYLLASRGPADDRAEIDAFYAAMGVRRLRDAYTVSADANGARDVSESRAAELGALRATLRALATVLPRVRARRVLPDDAHWVDAQRLRPLAASGVLRAVNGLRVRYRLAGVGEVSRESPAVYDASRGELCVDADTLADGEMQATGVALALLAAVYDGAGDEQLSDILEILLRLRTRERMSAYLDRRHFPAAESEQQPAEALMERVDAILDYGLADRLARRHRALAGRDLSAWRESSIVADLDAAALEQYAHGEREPAAALLATRLLDAAQIPGEASVREPLTSALAALLAARSLADVPAEVLGAREEESVGSLGPIEAPAARAPTPAIDASAWIQTLANAVRTAATGDDNTRAAVPYGRRDASPFALPEVGHSTDDTVDGSDALVDPFARALAPPASTTPSASTAPGLFRRMLRWLGVDRGDVAISAEDPPWARPDANCLAPYASIGPQFWATPANRARIASLTPSAGLAFAPAALPAPWTYGVHSLGATFDPATQSWTADGAPSLVRWPGARPTGRTVTFRGRVDAGESLLPLPLFARLAGLIHASDGQTLAPRPGPRGPAQLSVTASRAVEIAYEVELLDLPALMNHDAAPIVPAALLTPTMPERDLPAAVRTWLETERGIERTAFARAIAVQEFVRTNYVYDEAALERPEARRRLARLAPGRGNHHIEVLHATRDRGTLGRGVCYELNVLVVELLRHLGIGAMVATGWLFDLGRVDRPDHLFALALLPSATGALFVPLDGTLDDRGPRRPLASPATTRATATATPGATTPSPMGPWSVEPARRDTNDLDVRLRALAQAEVDRARADLTLLLHAIRLLCAAAGRAEPEELGGLAIGPDETAVQRAVALRALAERLLPDPDLLGALLAMLRGEYQNLASLPPRVEDLVRIGLAQVRSVPAFQVVPRIPDGVR